MGKLELPNIPIPYSESIPKKQIGGAIGSKLEPISSFLQEVSTCL